MYASSQSNNLRGVSNSDGWSDPTWDPQRNRYYQVRRTSNGQYEYFWPDGVYNQNEEESVPRTGFSSGYGSYSDERQGRPRETQSGQPRQKGQSVSPGPRKPTPPPRPGTTRQSEEVSPSRDLQRSMGGLSISGLSQNASYEQSYDYYSPSSQPQTSTEIAASPYYAGNTPVQKQPDYGKPQLYELPVVLQGRIDTTAVIGTSEVSLISERLAKQLGLTEKSFGSTPRLDGEDEDIRPTKQAYVEIRNGERGKTERVYIVPRNQQLRKPLILTKKTMESLASTTDTVTMTPCASSNYSSSSTSESYGGSSTATLNNYGPVSSYGSAYASSQMTTSSSTPNNRLMPYNSVNDQQPVPDSKPYDSRESQSRRNTIKDNSKHKHKHRSSRH